MTITTAELLDALAAATQGEDPADARTVPEMAAQHGMDVRRIRAALHALNAQGRLVVHKVSRQALDGRMAKVAAYTFRP
jgi:DNA-binding transcriptional regulator PaaX